MLIERTFHGPGGGRKKTKKERHATAQKKGEGGQMASLGKT